MNDSETLDIHEMRKPSKPDQLTPQERERNGLMTQLKYAE